MNFWRSCIVDGARTRKLFWARYVGPVFVCQGAGIQTRNYSAHPSEESTGPGLHQRKKVTLPALRRKYKKQIPITVITAHDYPSGMIADRANVDIALVGDSLAMVALGYEDTNLLTLDEMLSHCRAVRRGNKSSFIVGDLPFSTYEISPSQALTTALRMVREGRVEAVKLEGGREMSETISKITRAGIPVMGHIGLTPQRQTALGGFRVQGKTAEGAERLLEDAKALEQAGCFSMVIEAIPPLVAKYVTSQLSIPTIGIGAGKDCSGQVLVQMDMLGMFDRFVPTFVRKYANTFDLHVDALSKYVNDVESREFPTQEHVYKMPETEEAKLLEIMKQSGNSI
ncbi:putative ketopantoate hydroxymethyltransferase [Lipomyces oligophaga]|uniref:putative ketopantoate hydroxymethyltransferase n=1 Tax=Lipomyces oligophaga TaxID=45792 RepID=UPI0034CED560